MSATEDPDAVNPALQALAVAFGATDVVAEDDWVDFFADDLYIVANIVEMTKRVRIRVCLLRTDEEQVVQKWVEAQRAPSSGLIQSVHIDEGDWCPRLVFERPLESRDWSTDPLFADIARYLAAWLDDTAVQNASGTRVPYVIQDDPRDIAPASAWLLKGDEAAYPTLEELEETERKRTSGSSHGTGRQPLRRRSATSFSSIS